MPINQQVIEIKCKLAKMVLRKRAFKYFVILKWHSHKQCRSILHKYVSNFTFKKANKNHVVSSMKHGNIYKAGGIARRAKNRESINLALRLGFGICRIPTEHRRSTPQKAIPKKTSLAAN